MDKQAEVELPPLDVTEEDRDKAFHLTEEEWLAAYAAHSPIEIVAIRYCRERQLRATIAERDAALAQLAEAKDQLAAIPGFIYGKSMIVPIGSIGDMVATSNRADRAEAESAALRKQVEKLREEVLETGRKILEARIAELEAQK